MGRKERLKKQMQSKTFHIETAVKAIDNDEAKNILYEYALELAQEKYDYEIQREQELVQQSGQMQSAFSFMTAALFMVLPIALEYGDNLPKILFF